MVAAVARATAAAIPLLFEEMALDALDEEWWLKMLLSF